MLGESCTIFRRSNHSFGKTRGLTGLSGWEFMEKLKENQIPLKYDVEDFKEDLETVKELCENFY